MSSGFPSGSLVHKNCYETKISIPSLHISGESDEIIPNEISVRLEQAFENPTIVHHAGGHYLPASANEKQSYVNFFQDQLQRHLEEKELKNGVTTEAGDDDEEEQSS